jgi:PleD family two-component response regulator
LSRRAANIPDVENRAKLEDSRSEAINDLKPKSKHPLRRTATNTSATHDWATAKSNSELPRAAESPIKSSEELKIDSKFSNESGNIGSENMRVLLVEDNEINLNLLVAYMRKLKLDHATACNGLEALDIYKRARGGFDAIFMGEYNLTLNLPLN